MSFEHPQHDHITSPEWHTPERAREMLEDHIESFVRDAIRGFGKADTMTMALAEKVTAGLGKTSTTLRVIARHARDLLGHGHVLIYMPTLALAERAQRDFSKIAPRIPSRVLRGRAALRPGSATAQMCEQAELARSISGFVKSVTQSLCRRSMPDGTFAEAPCAAGCPYLAQKDATGPHVVFLSHEYLTLDPPIDRNFPVALRVIDEKIWSTLSQTSRMSLDDFMRPGDLADLNQDEVCRAKAAIVDGLQRNAPLHDHLRASKIPTEFLQLLAMKEDNSRTELKITPRHNSASIAFRLSTFDRKGYVASRRRAAIFSLLGKRESGSCNRLTLSDSRQNGQSILRHGMGELPRDAPVLLLDADADPDITRRLAPGAEFRSIESPPCAEILQVSDRTLSSTWLLDADKGAVRRKRILKIIEREVRRADDLGVLVVAVTSVLRQLHADVGQPVAENDTAGLRQPLLGAAPRWFGPSTQGVNDFENYSTVVVIGRLQPPVGDIEADARCVFGHDEDPIVPHLRGPLPSTTTQCLLADGTAEQAVLRTHPDQRVHAILAQTRECGTLQAIARLRLAAPRQEKRVIILSSIPLPGFPVTRRLSLQALELGIENEPDVPGFLRIQKALRATMGQSVRGARLSASGLAADLPEDFGSVSAARKFRRGRTSQDLAALCIRVAQANAWPITAMQLRSASGGKTIFAIVLAPAMQATAQAEALWPDYTCHPTPHNELVQDPPQSAT